MFPSRIYVLSQLTEEKRFYADESYCPFVIEGFYDEEDPNLQDLLKSDDDIYIVGNSNGGIELSRRSFWA